MVASHKLKRPHEAGRLFDEQLEGLYEIHEVDAFGWLEAAPAHSVHAVVTDPPYGLLEYTPEQMDKMRNGNGGVWRIPPSYDGAKRKPLPRFTLLTEKHKNELGSFFDRLAAQV
jgi:site-specific DNA-methyltransferase (adenine-specific)